MVFKHYIAFLFNFNIKAYFFIHEASDIDVILSLIVSPNWFRFNWKEITRIIEIFTLLLFNSLLFYAPCN